MYRLSGAQSRLFFGIAIVLSVSLALGRAMQPVSASPHAVSFGVNMHPLQDTYAAYSPSQTLGLASEIGASIVRIDIHWGWIEYSGPGTASWDQSQLRRLDTFLAEASRRHIQLLATVLDTPCWASTEPDKRCPPGPPRYYENYPPANPRDFANFLTTLIRHVGQKIQYYEIWNEPNLTKTWVQPDPVAYTQLLKAAYRAIKAQDPGAQVLAGATSGADTNFVNRMYEAGAKGYFDALSIHPYSGNRSPGTCSTPGASFRCGVERVRQIMLRHGDTRPLWLTELGESVSAGAGPSAQARYVAQAFSLTRRWSYVRGAVWYELYDDPTGHDGEHFGLFQRTLCPRPAARSFRSSVLPTIAASALKCPRSDSAMLSVARVR
ncbi:MAG TPA: glycosyl hydrolase [Chloroflexota bacterium]